MSDDETDDPALSWRDRIRKKLDKDQKAGPVFGDDENGAYCRFDPDGSKTVLASADAQAAYDRAMWGAGG